MVLLYVFVDPAHRTGDEVGYAMIVVLAVVGLWLLITGESTLTVDDDGLVVRTFRKEQRFAWRSITDFYTVRKSHHARDVVEFEGIPRARWDARAPEAESLRAAVLTHATRASAREWAPAGSRAAEAWPRTFAYAPRVRDRAVGAIMVAAMLGLIGWVTWHIHRIEVLPNPRVWFFATLGAAMITLLSAPAITLALCIATELDVMRRRHQRVTAREHGLRYEDERSEVVIDWGAIDRVIPHAGSAMRFATLSIESHRGSFDVSANLADWSRLKALLARRAPDAMARGKAAGDDPNDLLRLTPVAGVAVHHYRTRDNRGVIALLAIFVSVFVGGAVHDSDPLFLGALALPFALAGGMLLDNYLFTRVQLDARGITFVRRAGSCFVPWGEVTAWRRVDADALTHIAIDAGGKRRRVWLNVLDFEGLSATLAARVPQTTPARPMV